MANLSFADATGNFFNRLGKYGLLVSQAKSYQDSQETNMTDTTNGVVAQLNDEPDIQQIMGGSYRSILSSVESAGSIARQLSEATLNRMIYNSSARLNQTATTSNTFASLKELIRQMEVEGATVLKMTVAGTWDGTWNGTGNGAVVVSVVDPLDGLDLENTFAESITLECTDDSYSGSATIYNEAIQAFGEGRLSSDFDFDWPKGSNGSVGLEAIDALTDNGSGNVLTNSSFDVFTSDVPDNWTLEVGTAGTHVKEESTITFAGNRSVEIVGDGSNLTELRQQFDSSTGTAGTLDSFSQYSWCIWARRDATAASTGILTIDLVDGDGVVLADANGASNSTTIDLTALTTVFAPYSVAFRTPAQVPSELYLRMRLTTALENGRSVFLEHGSLGEMTQLYSSGPWLSVHSGAVAFVKDDSATVTTTNSRGSGGTLDTFQTLMARMFPLMLSEGLLLPSSTVPSISDNLIG